MPRHEAGNVCYSVGLRVLATMLLATLPACAPATESTPDGPGGGSNAGGSPTAGVSSSAGGPMGGQALGGQGPIEEESTTFAAPEALALRLARLIWNGEPDPGLASRLASPLTRDAVSRLADDMLSDPRARDGLAAFYRWWLQYDLRMPTDALDVSLQREAPALGTYLTLEADATFADLLSVPFTFVDETLAQHYGMSGVVGAEPRQSPYPIGEPRLGLFTGAGVLAHFSSLVNPSWPAKRGWLVTDPLLCTPVIRSLLPTITPDPARSLREQMIEVTQNPTCTACHKVLNSPGFAFIGFDWKGLWRPLPGAAPNETQGWIPAGIMAEASTGPLGGSRYFKRQPLRHCPPTAQSRTAGWLP